MTRSGWLGGCLAIAAVFPLASPPSASPWVPEIVRVERIVHGPAPLDQFRRPSGVAVDNVRGVMVVLDAGNHRLVLFDEAGRGRGSLTVSGGGTGSGSPQAIAVDGKGHLFVIDEVTHRITVTNGRGTVLGEVRPVLPLGVGESVHPRDLAVGTSGRIYVLYAGDTPGLVVLDSRGNTEKVLGFGTGRPPLVAPVSLAVSPDEDLVAVTDPPARHQVLVFGTDGRVVHSFGAHEEAKGGFSLAVDATWGPHGTLWVTDTLRHSISVFSAGSFLTRMGGYGKGPGQFSYPATCEFVARNRVVVVERSGTRFQIIELSPPESADDELENEGPLGLVNKEQIQR